MLPFEVSFRKQTEERHLGQTVTMGVSHRQRAVWLSVLVSIFLGSVAFLLWRWPLRLGLTVGLLVLAGTSAALLSAHYLPKKLDERTKRAGTVGVGCVALIVAVLAAGTVREPPMEPLTATLGFGNECETFAVPTELLPSLPRSAELNAQWVYSHNGATSRRLINLVVQGKTQDAVILTGMRVVDLKARKPPSDIAEILPCGRIQQQVVPVRYFDVQLGDPPSIVSKPGYAPDPQTGETEPATSFPYKVSNSEAEVFLLAVSGPDCFCDWRLALDWTSGDRSGTTTIDHGFGEVRSDTGGDTDRIRYSRKKDGTWDQLLPR